MELEKLSVDKISSKLKKEVSRISELDSLRGLAALSVVLFHYTHQYGEIFGSDLTTYLLDFSFGHYGVDFFFVISGFVIFLTLTRSKNGLQFVYNRGARLYPTFWVCLILTFLVTSFAGLERLERTPQELILNLTMVPGFLSSRLVDGAYWSLAVELLFYGLMFTLFLTRLLHRIEWVGFFWLILMVLNKVFPDLFNQLGIVASLLNLKYGMLFLIGINFYKIYQAEGGPINHIQIVACAAVALVVNPILEYAVVTLACIVVFYLFTLGKLKILRARPLLFLGKISYSWYLLHQFIGYTIISALVGSGVTSSLALLLVPMASTIFISYIVWKYVEVPSNLFLKGIYSKRVSGR